MSESILWTIQREGEVTGDVDVVMLALGYESRAIEFVRKLPPSATRRIALGFDHGHGHSYSRNLDWLSKNGFEIFPNLHAEGFEAAVNDVMVWLCSAAKERGVARVCIDISCFDRQRLAIIVAALWSIVADVSLSVVFVYTLAAFRRPVPILDRNEIAGPVDRRFAGRFLDPGRPLALIAGLGYELGKVVGAAEYLQASRVLACFPVSTIPEYEYEVKRANQQLLDEIEVRDVIKYPVEDLMRTIATLDSVVRGLREDYNVVMLPCGPKIFVLATLIVQRMHNQVAVWRVSSGAATSGRDVRASDHIIVTKIGIRPKQ